MGHGFQIKPSRLFMTAGIPSSWLPGSSSSIPRISRLQSCSQHQRGRRSSGGDGSSPRSLSPAGFADQKFGFGAFPAVAQSAPQPLGMGRILPGRQGGGSAPLGGGLAREGLWRCLPLVPTAPVPRVGPWDRAGTVLRDLVQLSILPKLGVVETKK